MDTSFLPRPWTRRAAVAALCLVVCVVVLIACGAHNLFIMAVRVRAQRWLCRAAPLPRGGGGAATTDRNPRRRRRRWLVLQYDDRPLCDADVALVARNRAYAARYGYEYEFRTHRVEGVPPYWVKVWLALQALASARVDGVLWLDTDAAVNDLDVTCDDLFATSPPGTLFVCAPDPIPSKPFNAGVWAVRARAEEDDADHAPTVSSPPPPAAANATASVASERAPPDGALLLLDWWDAYDPADWQRPAIDGGKWKARGPWGGVSYEQGAFAQFLLCHPKWRRHIHTLPYHVLQGWDARDAQSFSLHFMGHKDAVAMWLLGGRLGVRAACAWWARTAAAASRDAAALTPHPAAPASRAREGEAAPAMETTPPSGAASQTT